MPGLSIGVGILQAANTVQAAHPDKPRPDVTALARMRTDVAVIPTSTGNQLVRTIPYLQLLALGRQKRCLLGVLAQSEAAAPEVQSVKLLFWQQRGLVLAKVSS